MTGGDVAELEGDGLFLDHAERYEASSEFLRIWREVTAASHEGGGQLRRQAPAGEGAKVIYPPLQRPHPPIYFGGSSEAAHELAGEQVETYLTGASPAAVAEDRRRARARRAHGHTVSFGIRLHVIVRETEAAAWAAADDLISKLDDDAVARAQAVFAKMDSEGQRRVMRCMPAVPSVRARRWRSARTCGPA